MANIALAASQCKPFNFFLNLSFLILLVFYLMTPFIPSSGKLTIGRNQFQSPDGSGNGCDGIRRYEGYRAKCGYVRSESGCGPEGYINYLYLFYCICGRYPVLGYMVLISWLILLFYLLGNTTANYFCSNLEGLSRLLNLSPALAGVTLLSLGNGAPDVFSTIVSFLGTSSSDVGLNGVLGGAFFVSSVVVGTISISVGPRGVSIDRSSFIRDVCFFILVLLVLLAIVIAGEINVWGALAFTSLYAVYALLVSIAHCHRKGGSGGGGGEGGLLDSSGPSSLPLPASKSHEDLGAPLLVSVEMDEPIAEGCFEFGLTPSASWWQWRSWVLFFLDLPLCLPRRITIPDVCKERWSKPFAVVSVTLAPLLLSALWDSKRVGIAGSEERLVVSLSGGLTGLLLGFAVLVKTKRGSPPTGFLLPWLAGGFLMSVVWTYIIAEELVSLLVSLGPIVGISPSVLGLTVLAWGNSLGDLIANLAVAVNGGPGGAQVAMSGCYGGPIFNTLVGLGLSLVLSSWAGYPAPCAISKDPTLFQTLGFLIGGLLWALVMLPGRGMKPDRVLGVGLLAIYACFLSVRLGLSLGLLHRLQ